MAKNEVNIIEKRLEKREETLMVKGIYDKLDDYRKEHPESSFMLVSCNNKDKVGTSFLMGKEEDIVNECIRLMLHKNEPNVSRSFMRVFYNLFHQVISKYQVISKL